MNEEKNDTPAHTDPILSRLSWPKLWVAVTMAVSTITALTVTQNQIADNARRLDGHDARFARNEAADHVRDSVLIEINAERRRGASPNVPSRPAEAPTIVGAPSVQESRRGRDHTEFVGLWPDFPLPRSTNGAGWLNVPNSPRSRDTITRGTQ